jgi:omega-hydroxy-beta-dihydromenaquinone-9 sulfotransferase
MEIKKPIFLIGSGRSGTTILYKLLCIHPELCWFSNYTNTFPKLPVLSIFQRITDLPLLGSSIKAQMIKRKPWKILPNPVEGGTIYHDYCRFKHDRRTYANDPDEQTFLKFKRIIEMHLKFTFKNRFISKQTANTQRLRLINRLFPNAYFIHLIRDGREVANSYLNVPWWKNTNLWWLGAKPSAFNESEIDPIELCALQWRNNVKEILEVCKPFSERYLEVRYENLIRNPKKVVCDIFNFCELGSCDDAMAIVPQKLEDMSFKWKNDLNANQKSIVFQAAGDLLEEFGYVD